MDFKIWLLREMELAGLSNSELARRAGVSHARVSQILAGDSPGKKFLTRVAIVLGKPRSEVFSAAGIIEQDRSDFTPIVESTATMLSELDEDDQEEIRALVRMKYDRKHKIP